ncbi:MAG TPA: hypothetical protein VKU41_09325 [Polyangiaceae bacterium]|nr:hypothetical protein [Polyangiaceae bacterium]
MVIPPAVQSDTEDVVWALQTAEALWKRHERLDAIVWLRRAAQAAGDAEDDDRALALARNAAELAEWISKNPQSSSRHRTAPPASGAPTQAEAVDDLLRTARPEPPTTTPVVAVAPGAPAIPARSPPTFDAPVTPSPSRSSSSFRTAARVRTAAEAHAGMLDPWSEGSGQASVPASALRPEPRPPLVPPPFPSATPSTFEAEEVVTSAPPMARAAAPPALAAPPPPPTAGAARPRAEPPVAPATPKRLSRPPTMPPTSGVDLSGVEAFGDLPDDARDAFATAASVQGLARDEEVTGFALAFVLEGAVDLCATIVDAPAKRLSGGSVLRARGTIDPILPVRLVSASDHATVATWDEDAVRQAFGTCPWVEDELRAAGDLLQALVGVTMGPLGERLDPDLRAGVTDQLVPRVLAQDEVFATRGELVSGLFVVGAGELQLLGQDGAPNADPLRPGDFVFPGESLRAAAAPATVRASKGGAIVLVAERGLAQELLVTCPPLLEIVASA